MRKMDRRAAVTIGTTSIAIALTVYFHLVLDTANVFTHFYYIPVILATFWYGRNGLAVPSLLIIVLLTTDFYAGEVDRIFDDLIRSAVLIIVGAVMSIMSERAMGTSRELDKKRDQLTEAQRIGHMGNWAWDIDGKTLKWSEEVFQIFGKDAKSYVPSFEGYFTMVPEEERGKISDAVSSAVERGIVLDLDHTIVLDSGEIRVVHQRGEVIKDSEGRPSLMVGIVQDVTERKMIEDELVRANVKLSLASSISRHDMRNLLTSIFGYIELSKKSASIEKKDVYSDKALKQLGHLYDLFEETRDFQEIGTSEPAWNDLESMLSKTVTNVVEADRELIVEIGGLQVLSDPIIQKALYNLVENSLRHAEGASFIRFRVERLNGDVLLICEDDGPGIHYEEKEHIFEKGVGKNTGFGLFFVKEALAISGIKISETGEFGKGARFVIKIPSYKTRIRAV